MRKVNRLVGSNGYSVVKIPGHPLARRHHNSEKIYVMEHRAVAYEKYGQDNLKCFWCERCIRWTNDGTKVEDACIVDHLNGVKGDNSPNNLVVSCMGCNHSRGYMFGFLKKLNPARIAMVLDMVNETVNNLPEKPPEYTR